MRRIISLLFFVFATLAINAGVGDWKSYLAYYNIQQIVPTGDLVYVLSSNDLFSYNTIDESVTEYNKVVDLSDTYITHIAYCKSQKTLIVVYKNSNIDLLDADGNVYNVSDIYRKSMTEDKAINNIDVYGSDAYLSTGFGVVKLNVKNAEISATYKLGESISTVALFGNKIYAANLASLFVAETSKNLLDKSQWTKNARAGITNLFVFDNNLCTRYTNGNIYTFDTNIFYVKTQLNTVSGTYFSFNDNYAVVGNNVEAEVFATTTDKLKTKVIGNTANLVYDKTNKCYWQVKHKPCEWL